MLFGAALVIGGFITVPLLFVMLAYISFQLAYWRFIPAKRDEAMRGLRFAGFPNWLRVWAKISVALGVGMLLSLLSAFLHRNDRELSILLYIGQLLDL